MRKEKFMELIGSGAQADIYKDNSKAIKLFKYNIHKEEVENEFNLQKMAFDYGLPVPKVFDIIEIDNKLGIVMEFIDGTPLGEIILKNIFKAKKYLIKSIDIQNSIHKIETNSFPNMKNKLKDFILYRLSNRYFAEMYLNTYCKMKKLKKRTVLEWAPIVAAARLEEYVKDENERGILKEIIKNSI
jgi:hypothetical protein